VLDRAIHLAPINLDKMGDEGRNVFATFTQRGQNDGKYVQTVIEIAAKLTRSICSSHQPNVYVVGASAAQALELLLLQYTKQLWLQSQRDITDLIPEKGAFVGQLETTIFCAMAPANAPLS